MKKFSIEIVETLSKIVPIEAKNVNEALIIAERMYQEEEIVLDYNDLVDTEFNIDWVNTTLEDIGIGTK